MTHVTDNGIRKRNKWTEVLHLGQAFTSVISKCVYTGWGIDDVCVHVSVCVRDQRG